MLSSDSFNFELSHRLKWHYIYHFYCYFFMLLIIVLESSIFSLTIRRIGELSSSPGIGVRIRFGQFKVFWNLKINILLYPSRYCFETWHTCASLLTQCVVKIWPLLHFDWITCPFWTWPNVKVYLQVIAKYCFELLHMYLRFKYTIPFERTVHQQLCSIFISKLIVQFCDPFVKSVYMWIPCIPTFYNGHKKCFAYHCSR